MSRILLLANLNCDHALPGRTPGGGARLQYVDQGAQARRRRRHRHRIGVGGHEVIIASRVGLDDTGDWLLEQAAPYGLDCSHVERFWRRDRRAAGAGGRHR